jgi:hypothetical protein
MSYSQITFDEQVLPGDKLRFYFSFSVIVPGFRPSEQEMLDATNQAASVNLSKVTYDTLNHLFSLFGESGEIDLTVTEATTPNQIADDLRAQIANFKNTRGVQISEVDKDKFSVTPSPTTAITFGAIAIIAIVVLIFFLKLD